MIVVTATPVPPTSTPPATATPRYTATPYAGQTRIANDGATMVYVPAGEFTMGSNDDDNSKPVHTVYLDAFWIDKFEVTNAQYKKCVDEGKCQPPAPTSSYTRSSYYGNSQFDNYPVIYVSWEDADKYCVWAKKNLPTEAQWEKAARGGTCLDGDSSCKQQNPYPTRIYPWGDTWDGTKLNFCDKNCPFDWRDNNVDDKYADTAPVGSYPAGASPYAAMDMAGNVWEWVADWYSDKYYASSPKNNPKGPDSGSYRVLRSGSWHFNQTYVHAARRLYGYPDSRNYVDGFRCAQ